MPKKRKTRPVSDTLSGSSANSSSLSSSSSSSSASSSSISAEYDPYGGPSPCYLQGDINGDGFIGMDDLNVILSHWNQNVEPFTNGDLNGDGFVGIDDMNILLANWNQYCVD